MSESTRQAGNEATTGEDHPFQVILAGKTFSTEESPLAAEDDELSIAEIEAAYLQALETADAVEALFPEDFSIATNEPAGKPVPPVHAEHSLRSDRSPSVDQELALDSAVQLTPQEIVEGVLFVGGEGITTRKLCDLLGGSFTPEIVDGILDALNSRYVSECRPYELILGEGGYRLSLRPDYEPVRRKFYNQGPKDVKLSQDVLEVLAFIAYGQPATRADIEATEKPNVAAMLRQLLRRQLIVLTREQGIESYRTTARFLELFGLTTLDDLPQAGDFQFR